MDELIKAATAYLKAATAKLERENHPVVSISTAAVTANAGTPSAGVAEAPKKGRPKKEKVEVPAVGEPIAAAEDEITEEQSSAEMMKIAKEYVQRFQKGTPNGIDRAKKILADSFKVAKIGDLVHSQRIQFVNTLKGELAAAE